MKSTISTAKFIQRYGDHDRDMTFTRKIGLYLMLSLLKKNMVLKCFDWNMFAYTNVYVCVYTSYQRTHSFEFQFSNL